MSKRAKHPISHPPEILAFNYVLFFFDYEMPQILYFRRHRIHFRCNPYDSPWRVGNFNYGGRFVCSFTIIIRNFLKCSTFFLADDGVAEFLNRFWRLRISAADIGIISLRSSSLLNTIFQSDNQLMLFNLTSV